MNKLEEYREKLVKDSSEPALRGGFDAAIALDLPVKFAEWLNNDRIEGWYFVSEWDIWYTRDEKFSYSNKNGKTTKELYQYWLDNVYKPE